ncbi:MAG: MoaD/ThiS family protein [Anaerolineae bacterium]|nr:MoaD/ThiS family protein [Anaerolineae bacterium]
MVDICVEVWLYGPLARYGGSDGDVFAQMTAQLPEMSTVQDLLAHLGLPTEERGITFINGNLSAMPGLQPDLGHVLSDGDRVSFFHLKSMWPFQYRHDVSAVAEFSEAMQMREDGGIRSLYET